MIAGDEIRRLGDRRRARAAEAQAVHLTREHGRDDCEPEMEDGNHREDKKLGRAARRGQHARTVADCDADGEETVHDEAGKGAPKRAIGAAVLRSLKTYEGADGGGGDDGEGDDAQEGHRACEAIVEGGKRDRDHDCVDHACRRRTHDVCTLD